MPNPESWFGHTATSVNTDKVIVFGGAVGTGVFRITNDTFSFECSTRTWTAMRPHNLTEGPSPRAAHAATCVDSNQLVIFGGAYSNGNLVDNELYLLKIINRDSNARWIKVPVKGNKPSARYGHTLNYIKPYIILFGGTTG